MNKKFIVPLFVLFISSFFLLSSRVSAEEFSGTLSSEFFDYDSDNSYIDLKNYIDNYMQQNNLSYYIIIYPMDWNNNTANFNKLLAYVYSDKPTFSFLDYSYRLNLSSNFSSSAYFEKYKGNSVIYSPGGRPFYNINNYVDDSTYGTNYMIIDTNIDFIYNGSNSYTFNSSYGSYTISNGVKLKGLVELANSTPSDDTPLLTSFIDISIEKLAVICNFITSSYIYLAPFVILIFYFVILLFRRFT